MRKFCLFLVLALLLPGCARQETLETVADELIQPVMAEPREISVRLPEEGITPALESGEAQIYLCEDYELVLQTLSGGDLEQTLLEVTGLPEDALTVVRTDPEEGTRYDFVWVSAGETGELLGRGVILDDGQYHYCMSVLRPAEDTRKTQIVWSDVFNSFTLT